MAARSRPSPPRRRKQFDDQGFFVLEDAFDADTLAAIDDAIAPGESRVEAFLEDQPDGRFSVAGIDTQTVAPHLVARSDVLRAFCAQPTARRTLPRSRRRPTCASTGNRRSTSSRTPAEPVLWHQDNGYTFVEPQAYLTCWIALTDATPENGCVMVMPGAHREGTLAHREHTDRLRVLGRRGHGGRGTGARGQHRRVLVADTARAPGRNRTDDVRKAYIVQYAPDGAVAYRPQPDGSRGPAEPQDDERRQYRVVGDGARIPA